MTELLNTIMANTFYSLLWSRGKQNLFRLLDHVCDTDQKLVGIISEYLDYRKPDEYIAIENSRNHNTVITSDHAENIIDHHSIWENNLKDEINFWDNWLKEIAESTLEPKQERLDPDFRLQSIIAELLNESELHNNVPLEILDIGAGPLTVLGKKWDVHPIRVTAVDPLAYQYKNILAKYDIEPLVETIEARAENLLKNFREASFDLVSATNCLDHSENPLQAIMQALAVVKPGGYVILLHSKEEAHKNNYFGLHQWNFTMNATGDFIISDKVCSFNVSILLEPIAHITCEVTNDCEIRTADEVIVVRIRKKYIHKDN